jgi:hypothetical protein
MMYHLGYTSTETRPFSGKELRALLESARRTNEKLDVTGLLLHRQNSFFQVLEGDKTAVMDLYHKISLDHRHHRVEMLFDGDIGVREFVDWRMGFVQLDDIDASQLPGFSDYLENYTEPRELFTELSKTQRLMVMFRNMV